MSKDTLTHQLTETIEELSSAESMKGLFHQHRDGNPLPSGRRSKKSSVCPVLSSFRDISAILR